MRDLRPLRQPNSMLCHNPLMVTPSRTWLPLAFKSYFQRQNGHDHTIAAAKNCCSDSTSFDGIAVASFANVHAQPSIYRYLRKVCSHSTLHPSISIAAVVASVCRPNCRVPKPRWPQPTFSMQSIGYCGHRWLRVSRPSLSGCSRSSVVCRQQRLARRWFFR